MIETVVRKIFDGLTDNATLDKFCQDHYDKNLLVYFGNPAEKPAVIDDAPHVQVGIPTWRLDNEIREYKIPLAVAIKNDTVLGSKFYSGALEVSEFAELVAEEIAKLPLKVRVEATAEPTANVFPLFYVLMTAVVEKKKPVRPLR